MHSSRARGQRLARSSLPIKRTGGARTTRVRCRVAARPRLNAKTTMEELKATRLITALKTPYLPNGKFDLVCYDEFLEDQIENGVEGVIVGGTTGEGQLMSWDEHIMLIAHTVNTYGREIKVIGNTGSNSTREALHATEQGFNVGMHASLQINPYYGKTSEAGMKQHFLRAMDLGPAMIYNVPARTGQDITTDIMESIAGHNNFIGVKECEGNERIAYYTSKGISCWSGNDDEAHDARHEAGAVGVVSVTSNVIPGIFSKLMGDEAQPELNQKVQNLISWLFKEPNPIGINTCLSMTGQVKPVFRLPYVPYSKEMREEGLELLKELGADVKGHEIMKAMEDSDFVILDSF
ncbi:dihydrodipicolinate synthase [Chloropicon primus]|uniref:4-hydroxy-tetrahydrodipicolinate synthase n=1 Tax=Chloropicon primus TaxID=1764295 RepID=A0A5B8MG65_9CHLO|nr:dihydrodipicolinate synthase [Chloropicon primus]UPQ98870.1 dihydrodipicolinate synthase [Chloropicon primus]|eukprot:QDZ19658.1 dihydrodipicolinate synthase [Chloropicon primus]